MKLTVPVKLVVLDVVPTPTFAEYILIELPFIVVTPAVVPMPTFPEAVVPRPLADAMPVFMVLDRLLMLVCNGLTEL